MRALVLSGDSPTLTEQHDAPILTSGEAIIRPLRMGVCGTDLELLTNPRGFTGVLGHEFVGIVESVADKADKGWVGKRVVGEINCVCGECDMCKAGLREHCRKRSVLGILDRDGCFAEAFALPIRNLLEVPDNIDDDHAVFIEPLAAAFQILRQLTIEGRPYITILGDGRLGLLCVQILSKLNATVRCIGKHETKLGLCEKWGIKHRLLSDVGLRQDQDIVVDCTGCAEGLKSAMQMVRPRGTIVLKSTALATNETFDLTPIVRNEINLIGSRCGPFDMAMQALSAGEVDVASLISRRMKLSRGVDALALAAQPDTIKVLLDL